MVETFKINTIMDPHAAAYHAFCSIVYNARKALLPQMSDDEFRTYDNAVIASNSARGMPNPYTFAWQKHHDILAAKVWNAAEPRSKRPKYDEFNSDKICGD
jgi:hypothetical protein